MSGSKLLLTGCWCNFELKSVDGVVGAVCNMILPALPCPGIRVPVSSITVPACFQFYSQVLRKVLKYSSPKMIICIFFIVQYIFEGRHSHAFLLCFYYLEQIVKIFTGAVQENITFK